MFQLRRPDHRDVGAKVDAGDLSGSRADPLAASSRLAHTGRCGSLEQEHLMHMS